MDLKEATSCNANGGNMSWMPVYAVKYARLSKALLISPSAQGATKVRFEFGKLILLVTYR